MNEVENAAFMPLDQGRERLRVAFEDETYQRLIGRLRVNFQPPSYLYTLRARKSCASGTANRPLMDAQQAPSKLPAKPVSASASVLATLMEPANANPMGNIHGGHIMKLTDQAGAAAAIRHAGRICVTASIDRLDFVNPVHVGDMVVLKSAVNYTHRTWMEVGVRIEAERLETGERKHVATAYLIFVALDENGKPAAVPPIKPETESEKLRYRQADLRYRIRQDQRVQERAMRESEFTV